MYIYIYIYIYIYKHAKHVLLLRGGSLVTLHTLCSLIWIFSIFCDGASAHSILRNRVSQNCSLTEGWTQKFYMWLKIHKARKPRLSGVNSVSSLFKCFQNPVKHLEWRCFHNFEIPWFSSLDNYEKYSFICKTHSPQISFKNQIK